MAVFTTNDIFSHEKVSDRLCVVRESYSWDHRFPIGLVIGDDKAIVIDSGLGAVDGLRRYTETITDKPLVCILTHGHPDHAGGAILFDEAYMNERDLDRIDRALDKDKRLLDLESFSLNNKEIMDYAAQHCVDCTGTKFKNIDEGEVIDAGGVKLEVIKIPGHSNGSIALYNRAEGYAFVGDAILKRTHLGRCGKEGLLEYADTVRRFISMVEDGITLYNGHQQDYVFPGTPTLQLAKDLIAACEEVADGKTENDIVRKAFFKDQDTGKQREMIHIAGCAHMLYDANLL